MCEILVENRKFSVPHVYLTAPVGMTPSEFNSRVSCGKTRMTGLPGDEKRLTVSLAVLIQYNTPTSNVTDGQTDRRTDGRMDIGRQQDRAMQCMHSA